MKARMRRSYAGFEADFCLDLRALPQTSFPGLAAAGMRGPHS